MYKGYSLNLFVILNLTVLVAANGNNLSTHSQADVNIQDGSTDCRMQLDLLLLLDESSSISSNQWKTLVPFVKEIVTSLDIGYKRIRLSLVTYGSAIRNLIGFLDEASKSKPLALEEVEKLWESKPQNSQTYTGLALTFAREVSFKIGSRNKVPKAIILITDGASSDPQLASQVAAQLRSEGVTILVVGVENASTNECRHIAGCHISRGPCPTFINTNWVHLQQILGGLMKQVCNSNPRDAICDEIWSNWSQCSAKCGKGIRTKQLVQLETIKSESAGTNGRKGRSCDEQFQDYEPINEICEAGICSIDAKASEWSNWSVCSVDCGEGVKRRQRYLLHKEEGNGKSIEELGINMNEEMSCKERECPVDAGCGIFGKWSECKQPCGKEVKRRKRLYFNDPEAMYGGKTCEEQGLADVETEDCGNDECPKDFIGQWSEWSDCNAINEGHRYRKRIGYEGSERVIDVNGKSVEVVQTDECNERRENDIESPGGDTIPVVVSDEDFGNQGDTPSSEESGNQGDTPSSEESGDKGGQGDKSDPWKRKRKYLDDEYDNDPSNQYELENPYEFAFDDKPPQETFKLNDADENKMFNPLTVQNHHKNSIHPVVNPDIATIGKSSNDYTIDGDKNSASDMKMKRSKHQPTQSILSSYKSDIENSIQQNASENNLTDKKSPSNTDENTDENKQSRGSYSEYKVAGGILGALALLGSGGYVYFKRSAKGGPITEREVLDYDDNGRHEYDNDEEKFTVTEMDDTLWGETT